MAGPTMWTVYERPKDFPTEYVARRWEGETRTADIIRAPTLEALQTQLSAKRLTWMPRMENDEPQIVGVWL